jgi:CRP-like cAMP-binding protein
MSGVDSLPVLNQLIEHLPAKYRHSLLQRCELVDLQCGRILCERGEPFRQLYFPLTGVISQVALTADHPPLEMGLIGNEGMLGGMLTQGVNRVPLRAVVQGSGTALRISASQLREELLGSPALMRILNRYLYVLMTQLAQTAACNRFHEVPARLARWLLMSHDRTHAEHFYLTHQFLADMLGVQRSAVTIAAGALQQQGLIHYSRGKITVLSREGLERLACECYAALNNDYAELFAAPMLH